MVTMAARARKTKARGEEKLDAELVFGVDVVLVVEVELVVEDLLADDVVLLAEVLAELLLVTLEETDDAVEVDPVVDETADDDETEAAPPVNVKASL